MVRESGGRRECSRDTRRRPGTPPPSDRPPACAGAAAALSCRCDCAARRARSSCSNATASGTPARRETPGPARRARSPDAGSGRRPRAGTNAAARASSRIASSVAAACSSKLNCRQKRLRSARPHARFTRLPNGACSTSCMPPDSSKNRSSTSVSWVGSTPSARRASARYATICSAAARDTPTRGQSPFSVSCKTVTVPFSRAASTSASEGAHRARQLVAARRSLAEPERDRRRRAFRVRDPHDAGADLENLPRRVAELEDVARRCSRSRSPRSACR